MPVARSGLPALAASAFAAVLATAAFGPARAATPVYVTGPVTSVTAQLPAYTVFIVGNQSVRFCSPTTGADYPVTADNLLFTLLKSALDQGRHVDLALQDFGLDPGTGGHKLCLERVIILH